ncbi:unnamed protein product [Pleuronectes platessa]|uniref:Uncharacterized protein n=1 Tax=Pleuronectes platessa TaxID=8262 RepID=A0A9N7YXY0_PLEPL|nr:unnamed protein product [Pleuronectes platessa]
MPELGMTSRFCKSRRCQSVVANKLLSQQQVCLVSRSVWRGVGGGGGQYGGWTGISWVGLRDACDPNDIIRGRKDIADVPETWCQAGATAQLHSGAGAVSRGRADGQRDRSSGRLQPGSIPGISGFIFRDEIKGTFLTMYSEAVMNYDGRDDRSLPVDAVQLTHMQVPIINPGALQFDSTEKKTKRRTWIDLSKNPRGFSLPCLLPPSKAPYSPKICSPRPISTAISEVSGAQKTEEGKEKQAVTEITLSWGWSILPGPQPSLLQDLRTPAGVTTSLHINNRLRHFLPHSPLTPNKPANENLSPTQPHPIGGEFIASALRQMLLGGLMLQRNMEHEAAFTEQSQNDDADFSFGEVVHTRNQPVLQHKNTWSKDAAHQIIWGRHTTALEGSEKEESEARAAACGTVLAASVILLPPLTGPSAIGAGRQRRTEVGGKAEKEAPHGRGQCSDEVEETEK